MAAARRRRRPPRGRPRRLDRAPRLAVDAARAGDRGLFLDGVASTAGGPLLFQPACIVARRGASRAPGRARCPSRAHARRLALVRVESGEEIADVTPDGVGTGPRSGSVRSARDRMLGTGDLPPRSRRAVSARVVVLAARGLAPTRPRQRGRPGHADRAAATAPARPTPPRSRSTPRDGPHALIGGTPAPARASCCRRSSRRSPPGTPRPSRFLLVDYKGGAAFKDCARCRTRSGWSPTSTPTSPRGRAPSLLAEVRRREALLAEAGAATSPSSRAATPSARRRRC